MRKVGAIISVWDGYLCQLRDNKPGIEWPGYWGLFGGHVDRGESDLQAIWRELQEELAWVPRKIVKVRECDGIAYFHCRADNLSSMVQREGRDMDVFPPYNLPHPMIPFVRQLLAENFQ